MRRILSASNEYDQLGDTTTLADPGVVDNLVNNRKILKSLLIAKILLIISHF